MAEMLIAEIPKNSKETIRVAADVFKGVRLLQLRVWARNAKGEVVPTKAGIAVRVELIPELLAAVQKAADTIKIDGGAV